MSVKKGFDEIAKSLGLVEMNTDRVIDNLKHDILLSMYRKDPKDVFEQDLNKKIQDVYKEWFGSKFEFDGQKNLSMFLIGPPGQGKTTSFKVAAKFVADKVGLRFVQNPGDEYQAQRSDFLFVSLECSGENSSTTFGGIPAKMEESGPNGEKIVYMKKLPNKRLALLSQVAGGLLLLDDFSNAAPNVQNVALSIADEKRFQGLSLEHNYVGLTGNLGALDGTHTTKSSSALRGRCIVVFTRDKIENFISRALNKHKDAIGDVGVVGFLQRNPECFAEMPDNKQDGGFPSPRTWDHLIEQNRSFVRRAGGRGRGEMAAYENIKDYASIILGPTVGLKLQSYFYSLIQGADPLARQVMIENKLDTEQLKTRYGNGLSEAQQSFGYQFAMALSDYAVQAIVEDKEHKLDTPVKRWAKGILTLNQAEYTYAIDYFKAKLAIQVEEFSSNGTEKTVRKTLSTNIKEQIGQIVASQDDFSKEHRKNLIDALSDYDKINEARRSRRTSR